MTEVINVPLQCGIFDLLGIGNPFEGLLKGLQNMTSGTNIREPNKAPDGKNFFDYPGKTIDNVEVSSMRELCPDAKAVLVVNVASN